MTDPYLLFIITVAVAVAGCVTAGRIQRAVLRSARVTAWLGRAGAATDAVARTLTRPGTAVTIGLAALSAMVVVLWPLGWLARSLEAPIDIPVLEWAGQHQGTWWAEVNNVVTTMGNNRPIQLAIVATAVPLAMLWRHRDWWLPALIVPGAYLLCRIPQTILENVIGRNLPPTSGGDYPSGGVARTIAVYGSIIVLTAVALRARPVLVRLGVALAVVAGAVEAYTRVLLQKHWLTDSIAGFVLGVLVLSTVLIALSVIVHANQEVTGAPKRTPARPAPTRGQGQRRRSQSEIPQGAAP